MNNEPIMRPTMNICARMICFLLLTFCWPTVKGMSQSTHILLETDLGKITVMLYDLTPRHKKLIIDQIENGNYAESFFNRIVDGFVVQGGELDDVISARERSTGHYEGRLEPEFDERAFHKIGALGAGRDDNPGKGSFFNQIYFVVGGPVSEAYLDTLAQKYNKRFHPERRDHYLEHGGQPRLDGDYTVFGEVVEGLDVLLKISKMKTNTKTQQPKKEIKFSISII